MSNQSDLITHENTVLTPEKNPSVRALWDIKQSINPSYLDWLAFWEDGTIDLSKTVLRLSQWWSQACCENRQQFQYGPCDFRLENIVGSMFQYELEVPKEIVRSALAQQVKAGLLVRDGVAYKAARPTVK